MRICTLASGSRGNSVFVESDGSRLLIDAGLTCKELVFRLSKIDVDPATISGILFTHEHLDHVRGAGVMGRRFGIPLYFNQGTRENVSGLNKCIIKEFDTGETFELGGFRVRSFSIPHDAADPVGFTLKNGRFKVGVTSDLGFVTQLVEQHLIDSDVLFLESNHDPLMLETGPYPPFLKQRVAGKNGHLANTQCAQIIASLAHEKLRQVVLTHLSEQNNTPELAGQATRQSLDRAGYEHVPVQTATQYKPCPMVTIGAAEQNDS